MTPAHRTHGRRSAPLVEGEVDEVRDHALLGYWGRHVHVVDRDRHYARAPVGENLPLAMWSNRWSTMPIHSRAELRLPRPDRRAATRVHARLGRAGDPPALRAGDLLPFWAYGVETDHHLLHDLDADPWQTENRAGTPAEKEAIDLLRAALDESRRADRAVRTPRRRVVPDAAFGSRQEQVDVAELVPEVALVYGRGVRDVEHRAAGDRLEHQQV